jgi:uncharacterized protein
MMRLTRREFIGTAAAVPLTAADSATKLPMRVLGKTGARVSIMALGTGSRFLMYKEDDQAIESVRKALDAGITYIDTADDYGRDHLSERRVGQAIRGRRKDVFLATKVSPRSGDEAARNMEASLKALQVDQVDLLHIHALLGEDDLAAIEAKGGVLERLYKARNEKIARFIGITSHMDPAVLKTALERHDFDCTQMALNAAMTGMTNGGRGKGMVPNPAIKTSFETLALPVAIRKNMGVIAMKVFAQDALIGQATPEKLLYYSLTLPVATAVIGMPKLEHVDENVRLAKAFQPLPKSEMKRLAARVSERSKQALDHFFANHIDG